MLHLGPLHLVCDLSPSSRRRILRSESLTVLDLLAWHEEGVWLLVTEACVMMRLGIVIRILVVFCSLLTVRSCDRQRSSVNKAFVSESSMRTRGYERPRNYIQVLYSIYEARHKDTYKIKIEHVNNTSSYVI